MHASKADRRQPLPLYRQVVDMLRKGVQQGQYSPGSPIPSERELCAIHGVSRITAIKSIDTLVREGLLERRPGVGTFVVAKSAGPHLLRDCAVGFVSPLLRGDNFFNDIVHGTELALSDRDMSLVLAFSRGSPEEEWRCMQRQIRHNVAGLILFMCDTTASWENVRRGLEAGLAIVLVDHRAAPIDEGIDTVASDNLKGGFLAARHLLSLGHTRIGVVAPRIKFSSVLEREEGYRMALAAAAIPFDPALVVTPPPDADGGNWAADQFLAMPNPPTAVFGINDGLAISTMDAFTRRGRRIPEQLSVVGFDDNVQAGLAQPALTTIRQSRETMGRTAVELLAERIARQRTGSRHVTLDVELIVRASTAPVAKEP